MRLIDEARIFYQDMLANLVQPSELFREHNNPEAQHIWSLRHEASTGLRRLDDAQKFILDKDSIYMLSGILDDMGDRVFEMFRDVPLPFPKLWIEHGEVDQAFGTLLHETATGTEVAVFAKLETFFPPLLEMTMTTTGMSCRDTAMYRQSLRVCPSEEVEEWKDLRSDLHQETYRNYGLAKALSFVLLQRGMLDVRETSEGGPTRAERRRAEREGRPLPTICVSRISLGDLGKRQLAAMVEEDDATRTRRRAHWVRGHPVRYQSGKVSWRSPHIRGTGPLIDQERHIRPAPSDDDMPGLG